mmetsp:Transcript_63725/g.137013  ORF Transcript_63725/g.137013 Transcript_63725/m.137013 type:complete len:267 (-) Transcript_63725:72-872(-)
MPPKKEPCKKCAPLFNEIERELQATKSSLASSDDQVNSLKALELANRSEQAALHERVIGELESKLRERESAEVALRQQVEERDVELAALKEELANAGLHGKEELERALKEDEASDAVREERLRREAKEYEIALAEARRSIALQQTREAETMAKLVAAQTEVARLRDDVSGAEAEVARVKSEEKALTARLAQAEEALKALGKKGAAGDGSLIAATEHIVAQRAMFDGSLIARPNLLDPAVNFDIQLARLRQEGQAIAAKGSPRRLRA